MFQTRQPVAPIAFAFLAKSFFGQCAIIVEEACLFNVVVFEPKFSILNFDHTLRFDRLCKLKRAAVFVSVFFRAFRDKIQLQILVFALVVSTDVKIQGDKTIFSRSLSEIDKIFCDFFHVVRCNVVCCALLRIG